MNSVEYWSREFNNISEINILFADEAGEQIHFNDNTFSTMYNFLIKFYCYNQSGAGG